MTQPRRTSRTSLGSKGRENSSGTTVIKVQTAEVADAKKNVFFNYDETLTQGELKQSFTAIGQQAEKPNAKNFTVSGAHANGSTQSKLDVGVSFSNTDPKGKGEDLVLLIKDTRLKNAPKNDKGTALSPLNSSPKDAVTKVEGGWEVRIKPGETVQVPLASVEAHPSRNAPKDATDYRKFVRDGTRMVTYGLDVTVKSGKTSSVAVNDIARHPGSSAVDKLASPAMPQGKQWTADSWALNIDPKHHQGVFSEREAKAVKLARGEEAGLVIGKVGAEENAAYNTLHTYRLQFDAKDLPDSLVFRGGGGPTLPRVGENGDLLPQGISDTKTYTISLKDALANKRIKQTSPGVYEMKVKFVPGNNGNLNISGQWNK